MAEIVRSSAVSFIEESTEGTLVTETAASFTAVNEGFTFEGTLETIESDELLNDIGATEPAISKEVPSGSITKNLKHSGVEGTAPDYAVLLKSGLGTQNAAPTERDTVAGSTAGTASAAATLVVDSGEGSEFEVGRGVLIKDSTNGYSVRHVKSVSTDTLTLNYNLDNAPGTGVNLGIPIHFEPASTGHVSYTAHLFQASTSSAYHQAIAGCKTTNLAFNFPANGFATMTCDFAGTKILYNPITITAATNDALDITDDGGTFAVTIAPKTYRTPHELAAEIQTKGQAGADASGGDDFLCSYSDSTGKFTISTTTGTVLSLLWKTGTDGSDNTGQTIGDTIGFSESADDTGATSYTADNVLTYNPAATPSYDSASNIVVKNNELLIGDFDSNSCLNASEASFTVALTATDEDSICAETGVNSKVISARITSFSATLTVVEHDLELFDKFINNTTTQCQFTTGQKGSDGNWTEGTVVSIWIPNLKLTAMPIEENNSFAVYRLTGGGFVDSTHTDIHINYL